MIIGAACVVGSSQDLILMLHVLHFAYGHCDVGHSTCDLQIHYGVGDVVL